jgi:CheY-like chemotaxis protein
MSENRVAVLGYQDLAIRNGCGMKRGWSVLIQQMLTVAVMVLATVSFAVRAIAQVPGPESFAQEPRTPLELWSAIDYLCRTGQSAKAVPYLDKFIKSQPSDENLVEIRDRFGIGSILRLTDDPATRRFAEPITGKLADAAQRYATQPDRLARFIASLTGTPAEQDFAVARLREAGPHAVPPLVEALKRAGITPDEHALLVHNIGRLDSSAVPPLLAVLDSGDAGLGTDSATALGHIGDPRAVPFLTYPASTVEVAPSVREAAQAAIARLTGRPFGAQPRAPSIVLTDAAWQFHRHQVEFPGDPVAVWEWDKDRRIPVPRPMTRSEAERHLGLRLAREATRLQPQDLQARTALTSLAIDDAIKRVGFKAFPARDQATHADAIKAGPSVLTEVLHTATADGKDELAAAAASALGQITDWGQLARDGRPHPLVDALASPGARTQFAAARALVNIAPTQPFPGASRVVPTLARFLTSQSLPRAVVIDRNPSRGSQLAGSLRALGYETVMETSGDQGFQAAAETADVDLVLVSHALDHGTSWGLIDTLTNLKSDARTADLPIYVYGPLNLEINRPNIPRDFPGVKYLVQPMDPATLEKLIGGRPSRFSDADRNGCSQEAAGLLARIAAQPKGSFTADLAAAEPALATALSQPGTSMAAAAALGDVPNAEAQQSLADVILDPSRSMELRRISAERVAHSIKRFGPLVSADQETQIAARSGAEADPQLRSAMQAVVQALRVTAHPAARTTQPIPAAGITVPTSSVLPASAARTTAPRNAQP